MSATGAGAASGRVESLAVTPVKGFTMQHPGSVDVARDGIVGDRAFFLVDDADKLLSATRTKRFLPYWARFDPATGVLSLGRDDTVLLAERPADGEPVRAHFFRDRYVTGHVVPGPWSAFLSDIADRPVRLARAADPLGGYDVHPMSLVSAASVDAVVRSDAEAGGAPRRFRMTVTVGDVAAFAEDTWAGGTVQVGGCVLRVAGPVRRCAAVQKHPDGLVSDVDPLRGIKEVRGTATSTFGRGLHLGVYADVEQPGPVRVGDSVVPVDVPA